MHVRSLPLATALAAARTGVSAGDSIAAVAEPATWALVGGNAMLIARRRKDVPLRR